MKIEMERTYGAVHFRISSWKINLLVLGIAGGPGAAKLRASHRIDRLDRDRGHGPPGRTRVRQPRGFPSHCFRQVQSTDLVFLRYNMLYHI